jgi:dipeptidyl-peptidase-4
MKNFVSLSLLLFSIFGYVLSQKKELTLTDAVLGQNRIFGPERMYGFQWVPSSTQYTFFNRSYQTMYVSSVALKSSPTELLTLERMNKDLGSQLSSFYGLEWLDEKTFQINDGKNYYVYSISEFKGRKVHQLEQGAENATYYSNSERVAYTLENNICILTKDGLKLKVTENVNKNIVSGQSIARNEFGINSGLFWSNNGGQLAFYQKDESEVHDYPLLDINQTPGALVSIKYPMAGQKSEKPKVGIYDLESKKIIYISPNGPTDSYLTNFSFTPNDQFVLIAEVNREQNHMWLNLYETKTGNFVRTILEEENEKWVEPEHPVFFPDSKSDRFVWISEKDGFNNLYFYSLDGKLIRQLTKNIFPVKEILTSTKDGKAIFFSATGPNPTNTLIYRVNVLNGKQQLVTNDQGTHEFFLSDNDAYFYDAFSSHLVPHKAMVFDCKTQKAVKILMDSEDKLKEYKIGTAEIGKINNQGTTLFTRIIKPGNFDPTKKYPVLIYVYGGPHAQMITNSWLGGANLWMYWIAEQGYLVYTLDGRGSANRGFEFESAIHRQLGKLEMSDQIAGVNYLKSLNYVDTNRLAVYGWSFGGFMTTSLMLHYPDVFKVGVSGGPVTDWKYYEVMYGERYMDLPDENKQGYEQSCLMTHAGNLKGDLLLIHGTSDDVVVIQHNYALVKKFIELGKQVDFFPYPMHKHNVSGKDRVHLMRKILEYIMEHNQ